MSKGDIMTIGDRNDLLIMDAIRDIIAANPPDIHPLQRVYSCTMGSRPGWRKLLVDYTYKDLTVPAGSFASTTGNWWQRLGGRFVNYAVPKFHRTLEASCVHDFGCSIAKTKKERIKYDGYFKEICELAGMNSYDANKAYLGVRAGTMFEHFPDEEEE
jgi:hypothetical protein